MASLSTPALASFLGLCCPGKRLASSPGLRDEREWGEGANEQQGRVPEGSRVFILMGWSRCRVNFGDDDWAREAVFLMRLCELSPVLGVARAGTHGFGRGTVGFSSGARETVCGTVGLVS
jgi:hypothetical protein